jgi:4-carboxymuconolactone decarboxylase
MSRYTARKVDTETRAPPVRAFPFRRQTRPGRRMPTTHWRPAPKFVQLTNDVVFDDLWRRSDLSLRDRSLVTIVALAAMGDDDQLEFYLRRGLESGLTRDQIVEAVTHLGFYAGWGKATRAMTAISRFSGK